MANTICLTDADTISLADIDTINLTCGEPPTPVQHGGIGRRGPYVDWEANRRRLVRDDDDLLVMI